MAQSWPWDSQIAVKKKKKIRAITNSPYLEARFLGIFLIKSLCTKNGKADHETTFPPIQKMLEREGLVGHFKKLPE